MEYEEIKKATILITDDSPESIKMLSGLLKSQYRIMVAITGKQALAITSSVGKPDLILLDINMPDIDGYEICKNLKKNPETSEIPIIFLTANTGDLDEEKGFAAGAEDYITKPTNAAVLNARIKTHLRLKNVRDFLKDKNEFLETEISRRTHEIVRAQDAIMIAMGSLAETRDNETGNHIRRTQEYIKVLAENLKNHDRFRTFLNDETIQLLYKSAPLHDIGKVGIPDSILKKPGRLTPEEFEIMKTHTTIGKDTILVAERALGSPTSFLSLAADIAWCHHEKWDGTGYPRGLIGDNIPFAGRLMAIPDVYDALISERIYKRAFTHDEAVHIIEEGKGTHFDPDVADTFLCNSELFREIAREFVDTYRHPQEGNP